MNWVGRPSERLADRLQDGRLSDPRRTADPHDILESSLFISYPALNDLQGLLSSIRMAVGCREPFLGVQEGIKGNDIFEASY